jgi:MFS family permease
VETATARRSWGEWWFQFPAPLRQLTLLRAVAAIGAGGVLYLTPMVFHQARLGPEQLGLALALAALLGTASRMLCGLLLDRGCGATLPVRLAALAALLGDGLLLTAHGLPGFQLGLLLQGVAMGLWWPAIELAVSLCCAPLPSARAYALARSADAAGVVAGALLGALLASLAWLRGIYLLDMAMQGLLLALLARYGLPATARRELDQSLNRWGSWLPRLLPLLLIAVLATAVTTLMQSALPLDLVRGGLRRQPLPEGLGALLIGLQLGFLLLLQWPLGRRLAQRPVAHGLALSLVCSAAGCLLLAASAISPQGLALLVAAQLPLAVGQAAFLPIASEAVVELTPEDQRGVAMALFSQCFAVSAVVAPPLAGELMRRQGHALLVWLLMAGACLAGLALVALLARQQRRQLLRVLSGQEAAGGHGVLYRLPPPQANRAAAAMADKATRADPAAAAGVAAGVAATESAGAVAAMTAGVAETVETVEATTVATPASSEGGAIERRSD